MITAEIARKNVKDYHLAVVANNTAIAKAWVDDKSDRIDQFSREGHTSCVLDCRELAYTPRKIAEQMLKDAGFTVSYNPKIAIIRVTW